MHALQGIRAPDPPASRGGAAQPGPQPGTLGLLLGGPCGILEHQLLGVGGPQHGLDRLGQLVIEELGHAEQVGGGVLPVGDDQGVGVGPGGAGVEDQALRQRGEAQLPGLQDDDAHGPARLLLPPCHGVELPLGRV